MFLRVKRRFKDGKDHRYWSIVENHRTIDNQVVQRHVFYLGEINDSQHASWVKTIEVFQQGERSEQMALFPADRYVPALDCETVQIRLICSGTASTAAVGLLAGYGNSGTRWISTPSGSPDCHPVGGIPSG